MIKEKLNDKEAKAQFELLTGLQKHINAIRKDFTVYDIAKMHHLKRLCAENIDNELDIVKSGIAKAKAIPIHKDNADVLKEIERKYKFFLSQAKKL